jgi:hypothetical protein
VNGAVREIDEVGQSEEEVIDDMTRQMLDDLIVIGPGQ